MALLVDIDRIRNKKKEPLETEFLSLSRPPEDMIDSQNQVDEVENRFRRRAVVLSSEKKADLEEKLFYEIQDWKDSRSSLKKKLKEWNNLYEGVVTVSDFPWPGASQLHVPIPKIKAREIKSTINRNTMRPVPFLMCNYSGPDALYKENRQLANDIEEFIEDKIKFGTNVHSTLKDAIIPAIRDGTCVPQVIWETEIERVTDYKMYTSPRQFIEDYPDAESAGVSAKEYSRILQKISSGIRYDLQYEYDLPTYDGPKAYLVPLIDFFHWPVFETEIPNTLTHGKRIWYKDYDIEKFRQLGKFTNKEEVEILLKSPSDIHDDENLTVSRDNIEGITRSTETNQQGSREYEFYELVHKEDLDGDGIKEKYLLYYHFTTKTIYRIERYPIRKGATTYFPLRLIKRDNRFLGISLIDDIADLSLEIDILHRMRINSRTITHVPTFKAKATAKDRFDPQRPQFRFQPGATFWLQDVKDVEQFDLKPVDLSGSIEEENFLMQLVNLVTGSDSGLSGQSNPLDPRAPARKQQELLRQSTNRIDDYVEALLGPFAAIGQFMLDLYYQYGADTLTYFVSQEDGSKIKKEIDRSKLFNPNVMLQVNGTSVFMNPDEEFDRAKEIAQILQTNPLTAQDPGVQRESLERILDASRVKNYKNLLPTEAMVNQVSESTPAGPVIPTQIDKEAEMKMALQKQKAAQRLSEAANSNSQEHGMTVLESMLESQPEENAIAA